MAVVTRGASEGKWIAFFWVLRKVKVSTESMKKQGGEEEDGTVPSEEQRKAGGAGRWRKQRHRFPFFHLRLTRGSQGSRCR